MAKMSISPQKLCLNVILVIGFMIIFQSHVAYGDTLAQNTLAFSNNPDLNPSNIIRELLEEINRDRALTDLRKLTGEEPICIHSDCYTITNRLTGSNGLYWAKKYIYEELNNLGYIVEVQDWSLSGYTDQNLVATKPGVTFPNEVIYLVAHLDGVYSPAADDNGSGAVDILELARILSPQLFSRTIVLLFSTGEEQGTLGVKSHLSQLSPEELDSIQYVVNIDMIGYDANADTVMELWHGDHAPSFALTQMMNETILAYQLNLEPHLVVGCG
jgi:acetylornithine deacetylase/succinyl-diaminopimelate desuccinylase-like protein